MTVRSDVEKGIVECVGLLVVVGALWWAGSAVVRWLS